MGGKRTYEVASCQPNHRVASTRRAGAWCRIVRDQQLDLEVYGLSRNGRELIRSIRGSAAECNHGDNNGTRPGKVLVGGRLKKLDVSRSRWVRVENRGVRAHAVGGHTGLYRKRNGRRISPVRAKKVGPSGRIANQQRRQRRANQRQLGMHHADLHVGHRSGGIGISLMDRGQCQVHES